MTSHDDGRRAMRRFLVLVVVFLLLVVAAWIALSDRNSSGSTTSSPSAASAAETNSVEAEEPRRRRVTADSSTPGDTPAETARSDDSGPSDADDARTGPNLMPEGTVVDRPRHTLRGRIVDPDGEPVSGAQVQLLSTWLPGDIAELLWDFEVGMELVLVGPRMSDVVVTTADGHFALQYVEGGPRALIVRQMGEESARLSGPSDDREHTIVVGGASGAVVGRVVHRATREPVVGAAIGIGRDASQWPANMGAWVFFNDSPSATTDAEGRFQLEGLPAGPHVVHAHVEGLAPTVDAMRVAVPATGVVEVLLELDAGSPLRGRCIDADTGLAVSDARIWRTSTSGAGFSGASVVVRVDEQGRFELPHAPTEVHRWDAWNASGTGYANSHFMVGTHEHGELIEVTVRLRRIGSVRLRCVDAAGAPLAGVAVALRSPYIVAETPMRTIAEELSVDRTDDKGFVQLGDVHPSELSAQLTVWVNGLPVVEREIPGIAPGELRDLGSVRAVRGVSLRGRVTRADDSVPPGRVIALPAEGDAATRLSALAMAVLTGDARTADLAPDGAFELPSLSAGVWDVYVDAAPGLIVQGVAIPADGEATPLDLTLRREVLLEGRVVRADGTPPTAATLIVHRNHPLPMNLMEEYEIDKDGRFSVTGFGPDAKNVRVLVALGAGDDAPPPQSFDVTPSEGRAELQLDQ